MTRALFAVAGVLLFAAAAHATDVANVYDETEPDPRFFFLNNNTTSLSVSFTSLIYGLLALLALGLLAAVLSFYLFGSDTAETGYADYGSSYSSYGSARAASSADPYSAIWEKMSVLDWIAMAEEMYRKFDATSMPCQQRVVCELHQNENTWGTTARKMNDAFSYLQYLELLNLPTEFRVLLDDYLEAANKGRTSEQSCEALYKDCEFSIKSLINKYNGSNAL